jgi:hypothetical protein
LQRHSCGDATHGKDQIDGGKLNVSSLWRLKHSEYACLRAHVGALTKEKTMRIATLVLTGMAAACIAFPAVAAKKRVSAATVDAFEACEKKAADQGLVHGQAGHIEFVRECMGLKPGSPTAGAR